MSRALLIDDDLGTLEGFGGVLRSAGFDVDAADCGRQALARIRHTLPDVILADLRLPDFSGVELLRQVRLEHGDLPFVLVTGFGSPTIEAEAMALGARGYAEKPLIGNEVVQVVQKALTKASPVDVAASAGGFQTHTAARWVNAIMPILGATADPRTVAGGVVVLDSVKVLSRLGAAWPACPRSIP